MITLKPPKTIAAFVVALVSMFSLAVPSFSLNIFDDTGNVTLTEASVTFNGSFLRFGAPLYIDNSVGRMMVPVRPIFEALGIPADNLVWDEDTEVLTVLHPSGTQIEFALYEYFAYVDSVPVYIDSPARMIDEFVYVPLRFVCEEFGAEVLWLEDDDGFIAAIVLE